MTTQHDRSAGPSPPVGCTGPADAVTAALNALAGSATPVPGEVLDRILEHACRSAAAVLRAVRGSEMVSVTEVGFGRPHCVVTDEAVRAVEEAQYAAGAGPGERAAHERRVVQVRIGEHGRVWPGFTAAAEAAGFDGVVAVPVFADGEPDRKVIGVVGAYTRGGEGAEFVDEARWWAGLELVTTAVSATLSESRRRRTAEGALARLRRAVSTREEVDRAVGVLMAVHAVTGEQAAVLLSELADQDSPHHSVQAAARRVLRLCTGEQP
ncbi:ANTAR domain-containing protein [Rhodococcus sp. NPDC057529]|uniref:ANTAR domain-containing protein n=1 Tax=Rhodococcus sp. NPDC057529 TaxID=3346158 RepID=UPI00366D30DD